MIGLVGIVVVLVLVFGGYMAAGGSMEIILRALPFEMVMIGGAAVGGFLLGNDLATIKRTGRDIVSVFRGPRWQSQDYHDLLCLLFELIWIARQNPIEAESHIENPSESAVFAKFSRIRADNEAVELICDTLRSASMTYDDPMQVEEVLDKRLQTNLQHALHTSHAVRIVADALPAIGIVAAVLGIIKTMGSIDQPPEVLGVYIGSALTGTFLGVFLSYCFVGPIAERMKAIVEEDAHFLSLIREVLIANLHAHPANICIEVGRQNTPHHHRPSFSAVEDAMRDLKKAA